MQIALKPDTGGLFRLYGEDDQVKEFKSRIDIGVIRPKDGVLLLVWTKESLDESAVKIDYPDGSFEVESAKTQRDTAESWVDGLVIVVVVLLAIVGILVLVVYVLVKVPKEVQDDATQHEQHALKE